MSFAASRPINPAGVTPVLTAEQVWKGLELKERQPGLFLNVIESCQVIQDEGKNVRCRIYLEARIPLRSMADDDPSAS
jgi:hypothetical protein